MANLPRIFNRFLDRFSGVGSYGGIEDDDSPVVSPRKTPMDSQTQDNQLPATQGPKKAALWEIRRHSDLVYASRFSSQFPLPLKQPRKNKGQDYVRVINDWIYRLISSSEYGPPTVVDWLYLAILEDKARKTKSRTVSIDSIWEVLSLVSDDGGSGYKRFAKGLLRWFHCKFIVGPKDDPGAMVAWDFFEAINIKGFTKKWESSKGNIAIFTEKHFQRIMEEEVPYDLEVLGSLAHSPGALAMYLFVSHRAYKASTDNEGIVWISTEAFLNQLGCETYSRKRRSIQQIKTWKAECDEVLTATGVGLLPLNIDKDGRVSIFPKHLVPGVTATKDSKAVIQRPSHSKHKESFKPRSPRKQKPKEFDLDWILEKELEDYIDGKIPLSEKLNRYRAEKAAALGEA